jgi:hypothetical protein
MADGFGPYVQRSIHCIFMTTKLNYLLVRPGAPVVAATADCLLIVYQCTRGCGDC